MPTRLQLGPHFDVEEFDCHDGTQLPLNAQPALGYLVAHILEPLRSAFGAVHIVSGYRTPHENGMVGGAPDSRHLYDTHPSTPAVDLTCENGTTRDWYNWLARQLIAGGLGYYTSHVHVDLRSTAARW